MLYINDKYVFGLTTMVIFRNRYCDTTLKENQERIFFIDLNLKPYYIKNIIQ